MDKEKRILLTAAAICVSICGYYIGRRIYMNAHTPDEYLIKKDNTPEYQQNVECAGYSSAYVLRHFGEDAHGLDLYNEIKKKNENGTVNPDAVISLLNKKGHSAALHLGDTRSLRYYISRGVPVIILCREKPGSEYLHYMAMVGYDKEKFYASDSLSYMVNEHNSRYNRSVTENDLIQMWDIGYPVKNIFITVK
ncbi:MAG: C39 family peptidase [Oscillospiraceae bacterium]|nr:C39 family peptidase [Oscillospiraceae bacterium]